MKTLTLLLPPFAVESELAELLERKFGAACFPDLHRWTLEGEDATVFVDFDRDYAGRLSADELRHLRQHLDFTPDSAVHVHASIYHSDSTRRAEEVVAAIRTLIDVHSTAPGTPKRAETSVR